MRYYCRDCEELVEGMKAKFCKIRFHDLTEMEGSTFELP